MMLWLPAALAGPATAQSATRHAPPTTAVRRVQMFTWRRLLPVHKVITAGEIQPVVSAAEVQAESAARAPAPGTAAPAPARGRAAVVPAASARDRAWAAGPVASAGGSAAPAEGR